MTNMVANDNGGGATTLVLTVPSSTSGIHRALLICPRGGINVSGITDNIGADTWASRAPLLNGASDNIPFQCWSPNSHAAGVTSVTITFASSTAAIAYWVEDPEVDPAFGYLTGSFDLNGSIATTTWTSNSSGTTGMAAVGYGGSTSGSSSNVSFAAGSGWTAFSGTGITSGHHGNATDGDDMVAERQIFGTSSTYAATGTSSSVPQDSAIFLFGYRALSSSSDTALLMLL